MCIRDRPYQYILKIKTPEEILIQRVGIRTVNIKDGVVLINNRPVKFKGVNRHDSSPYTGAVVSRMEDVYKRQTQDSFEEIMLRGFLIGYAKAPLPVILDQITQFLPRINNWSVCDSFCITLKIAAQYPSEFWDFFQPLLNSQEEFTLRFVLVMLLDYYINDEYIDSLFPLFDRITHQGYYCLLYTSRCV